MKILVVSDSHGRNDKLQALLDQYHDVDLCIHCGDIEADADQFPQMVTVRGNNDIFYEYPEEKVLHVEGHGIYITHSHRFPYKKRLECMVKRAMQLSCDLVCYGHTHIAVLHEINHITLLNPGSLWRSRDGKGPSYAILDVNKDAIHADIIYLDDISNDQMFF